MTFFQRKKAILEQNATILADPRRPAILTGVAYNFPEPVKYPGSSDVSIEYTRNSMEMTPITAFSLYPCIVEGLYLAATYASRPWTQTFVCKKQQIVMTIKPYASYGITYRLLRDAMLTLTSTFVQSEIGGIMYFKVRKSGEARADGSLFIDFSPEESVASY